MDSAVRILGIDPGLQITGYGVIDVLGPERFALVDAGVIRLDTKAEIAQRLVELEREVDAIIDETKPTICAIEELYSHYNHPRTAILMGHARGVLLLVAARRKMQLFQISANRIKQSLTGHGHASKQQMQQTVARHFQLAHVPEPPDVADALAVALCAARVHAG